MYCSVVLSDHLVYSEAVGRRVGGDDVEQVGEPPLGEQVQQSLGDGTHVVIPQWAPLRGHGGHTGGDGVGDDEEELDGAHEGGGGEDTSLLGSQAVNDLNTTHSPQLVFTTSAASGPGGRRPYRCALLEQTGTNKHTNIFCSFLYCYRRLP